jgi:hypothetical protein
MYEEANRLESALHRVREEIEATATRAGRTPSDIKLIAVSKGVPVARIRAGIQAGQADYGENRVQEAEAKHKDIGSEARWHFIGRLQRNKVARLVRFVHAIHSIDRIPLAAEVNARATAPVSVLLEVNVSGEQQKGGVAPRELPQLVEAVLDMPRLDLIGLMTMAPRVRDPEEVRPLFRELARLRAEVADRFSSPRIQHLSMGMSQDYVVAVEEGATMLRIGEAIFGPRARPEPQRDSVGAQGSRKVSP